jgi:hypothetical protein
MKPTRVKLPTKGLMLAPGSLARDGGALTQAQNLVCDAPGVYRKRQGNTIQPNGFGGPVWAMRSSKLLGNNLLINQGSNTGATALRYGDGSAAPTTIAGTYSNGPTNRMQMAVAAKNHYITTDEGQRRIESDLSGWFAGVPVGLPLLLKTANALLVNPGTGQLAANNSFAYRTTISKLDVEGRVMEGAPSGRMVATNNNLSTTAAAYAAGTYDVQCVVPLPPQLGTNNTALTTAYIARTYRSIQAAGVPADDMWLVNERKLTGADVAAGFFVFTDSTPDTFLILSPPLYTSPNVGSPDANGTTGLGLAQLPPPRARCLETFANMLFAGDLSGYQSFVFTIFGIGVTGFSAGDTITVNGTVFTGIAPTVFPAVPANNQFEVYVTATTFSENNLRTAESFVNAVNQSATAGFSVAAQMSSGGTGIGAQVKLISRLAQGGAAFTVSATIAAGTKVTLPDLTTGTNSSTDQSLGPQGIQFTPPFQPDAWPAIYTVPLTRQDAHVLQMKRLRNQMFIFTDTGIYRLTGTNVSDLRLDLWEESFTLLSRDLVVVCDSAIYAWGREGIARITSAGVEFISEGVEPILWNLVTPSNLSWVQDNAFAVAYRTYHKVVFHYPNAATDRNCGNALVFDTRQKAWTSWKWPFDATLATSGRSCAAVRWVDDLLFAGQWNLASSDTNLYKELRTYNLSDYNDAITGSTAGIDTQLTWNPDTPMPDQVTTWDQFHVFFEVNEIINSWRTPSSVSVVFTNDEGQTGSLTLQPSTAPALRLSRGDVPPAVSMGTRMKVQVTHSVASEFFSTEGMSLLVTTAGDGTVN